MRKFRISAVSLLAAFLLLADNRVTAAGMNLYSLSAVLMDAGTGRVLFEKEGEVPRPNASTTKVMTCILALENAPGDDYVQVSANAASQPDVQLGICEGEQYYLEDLLYSLMLKSHNDTAVAIAEHIGGSVEEFAKMMNQKAEEIGCTDTYFITPNGLDAEDENGIHHTTARDLACIMNYAIQNETFLKITQTRDYQFSDILGKRQFQIHNSNALLDMMDGVLSGKTGFTGNAGYCYVCACDVGGKRLIVSLLGCGWPNHKAYKWSDTRKLLEYGEKNFANHLIWKEPEIGPVLVKNGVETGSGICEKEYLEPIVEVSAEEKEFRILISSMDNLQYELQVPEQVQAPVKKGQKIGQQVILLNGEVLKTYPVVADRSLQRKSYHWMVQKIFQEYFYG